ncbi:MAG: flagellar hook protein FlgE [Helicobacteraceae bacterium]|nr:flagellar hook protein FlgE [Helicobacteraceae bacterium]
MLRSLWSGVSGMQAHQIALDVESNNISNVNTVGFKYSRASFVDMLSQIKQIAASPYKNGLGGQNDYSIGLGVGVEATTKVFSQGNTQNTDIKTDLAIEGDGFFIVSPDRGITHNYTRNGEFLFDANGNLVNTGGYIVQGWIRGELENVEYMTEDEFFKVDHTGPIRNIQIDPAMVMPAKSTSSISLRANLNAGRKADQMVSISALDSSTKTEVNPEIPLYDSTNDLRQIPYDMGVLFNADGDALALKENQGIWISYQIAQMRQAVVPTADTSTIGINGVDISFVNDSNVTGISSLIAAQNAINAQSEITGVNAYVDNGMLRIENQNNRDGDGKNKNILITKGGTGALKNFKEGDSVITAFSYQYTKAEDADSTSGQFRTTEDLRALIQQDANLVKNPQITYADSTASVLVRVNDYGMFELENKNDGNDVQNNMRISVSSFYSENVTNNVLFKEAMNGLATTALVEGGNPTSTGVFGIATHATSVDVVDSLGSQHTIRFEFYKTGDSEWSFRAILPEPAQFIGGSPTRPNIFEGGRAAFNSDGSLSGMNPPVLQFDPKNGSSAPQRLELSFGDNGTFGGLTSVDRISETYTISQNGYRAGDLVDIRFDANGTLLGAFSNGKSLALAQVALANFSNNAGLQAEGGNIFSQSGNSGDPIVGAPNTGRRGGVSGSKLEMSNVDLSRALTQLIVVQRGFQANSKAVTTSDQILNTLLGLKQ